MHDPFKGFGEVFFALCKSVNTPKSLALWLAYKHKSTDVFNMPPRASDYDSAHSFSVDYLCHSYVSKFDVEWPGIDRKEVALRGFTSAETLCSETNRRLRMVRLRGSSPRVEQIIFSAQRKISNLLGVFDLASVLEQCRWGSGATATLPRRRARPDLKQCSSPFSVTLSCLPLFKMLVECDPLWLRAIVGCDVCGPCSLLPCNFSVVDYNTVTTVPKSAKTERTIAKEPTSNGYLQQGVGRYIRSRLKRVGINLDDQTVNQSLASTACDKRFATIDLKAASDSISLELVQLLLPPEWYDYLLRLRSPKGKLPDGSVITYEKFSSMGNAFTFELESLLFWAIVSSVCGEPDCQVSVYGDDIICPQGFAAEVIEVLNLFGFETNLDKSFVDGRFFESCGKHYFDGIDVTPVYQKESPLRSEFARISAHNRLTRWALRSCQYVALDPTVDSAKAAIRRESLVNCTAPLWYEGDDSFLVPWTDGTWSCSHGSVRFKRILPDRRRKGTNHNGAYPYSMYLSNRLSIRDWLDEPLDISAWYERRSALLLPPISFEGSSFIVELPTFRYGKTDVIVRRELLSVK